MLKEQYREAGPAEGVAAARAHPARTELAETPVAHPYPRTGHALRAHTLDNDANPAALTRKRTASAILGTRPVFR